MSYLLTYPKLMDQLFGDEFFNRTKPVDITENVRFNQTAEEHTVEIDLPGVRKEDCLVETVPSSNGNSVRVFVKASRTVVHKGGKRDETFTREFSLNDVKKENVKASLIDGVLTVVAPIESTKAGKHIVSID
jgi:HSP20 family molecular chaperone IbpA